MPAGTGLLNFFYLDSDSALADPRAIELSMVLDFNDLRTIAVIPAAAERAVEVAPPARASVFEPEAWRAEPRIGFPDLVWDPVLRRIELEPDASDMDKALPGTYIEGRIGDRSRWPARVDEEDVAFGWAEFPTGNTAWFPKGENPDDYHHLLQFSGNERWRIEGEGGWMHFSIPTEALKVGEFSRAIPTHDWW